MTKMHAPAKPDVPVITPDILATYDAFLIGIPTRYGNFPAQWKTFWDATGKLWATGALWGKYAGVFVSTAGPGGGQETTAISSMSTFAHHGIIYVPLGYKPAFAQISNLTEVHGGSPWGAGTYAVREDSYDMFLRSWKLTDEPGIRWIQAANGAGAGACNHPRRELWGYAQQDQLLIGKCLFEKNCQTG